ncbi:MAG: 3-ketoacyl-ACP reductase [Anaerolineales bacterium]|nr:3-ketoacyl-ACP reductase [Anaerolineales bacterium]
MMIENEKKVAIVTGGSRGIGKAIALALGERGWRVIVNYNRNRDAAEETLNTLQEAGGVGAIVQADVANEDDRMCLVESTLEAYGRIDLLVNNAGMAPRQRRDLLEMTAESYDEVMAVNLKGPFFLTQLVVRKMIALVQAGKISAPKIVNVNSISAYTSSTARGEYCISKAGMGMMTALYADRLAEYGIGVYEVRPGIIATDMTSAVKGKYDLLFAQGLTPIARWGVPEDVAKAVLAIAEDYLPYSTGEIINVDGGFHLRRL